MELTLERTRKLEDRQYKVYKIGRYTINVVDYLDGTAYITTEHEKADYLPHIYVRDDNDMKVLGFDIQTTSYGALSTEEIKKVISGYNEALEVVAILTKEFVNK